MSVNSTVASVRSVPAGHWTPWPGAKAAPRDGRAARIPTACRPSGTPSSSMIHFGQNCSCTPGTAGASSQMAMKKPFATR
jgi:hypothetical protein